MGTSAHRSNLQLQSEQHPLVDDQSFASIEYYVIHLMHQRAYEEAARLAAGKAVLDVGCNVGYGLQIISSRAASVAGIDVSPRAVQVARERLGSTADVRLYDGSRSSFAPESFDVVTSFQVIEHVSEYDAYLSEIVRLLRPDGMVLFTTPNERIRLDPGMKPLNDFHVREFNSVDLKVLLSSWFKDVELRGLFGTDELYRIERDRCERGKIAARAQAAKILLAARRAVKGALPWLAPAVNTLRTRVGLDQNPVTLARSEMARFSTDDLFYRSDGLEDALDLLAVCRKPFPLTSMP